MSGVSSESTARLLVADDDEAIEPGSERSTVAMTLSMIRHEVTSLRAEVAALDLPPHESARFLDALSLIEHEAEAISAGTMRRRRGH